MRRGWIVAVALLASIAPGDAIAAPRAPAIRLVVRVDLGVGTWERWTLQCAPTGGTHPNRVRACRALVSSGRALVAPVPAGTMCSMIYAGPERATVTGSLNGKRVRADFARTNGCESARWDRARALFTVPGTFVVRGRVSVAPTCAVQHVGQDCEDPSVAARVAFMHGETSIVTEAVADKGFAVRLAPGRWNVTADAGMSCPTIDVVVPTPEPVVVPCDTGIR